MFVADDLGAWLVGLLADAGTRGLIKWALGSDEDRALRQAATAAVISTAEELRPVGMRAEDLARVINQVFTDPAPRPPTAGSPTMLEALQVGVARQLQPLGDRNLTGIGRSSAELLEVSVAVLAEALTANLVREIVVRGAHDGSPLSRLSNQLGHDQSHLKSDTIHKQGERIERLVGQLAARDVTVAAAVPPPVRHRPQLDRTTPLTPDELGQLSRSERRTVLPLRQPTPPPPGRPRPIKMMPPPELDDGRENTET